MTSLPVDVPLSGPLRRACLAATVADDKKAEHTVVLDVGDILSITDAFVITSAGNTRLVRTVVEEIEQAMKEHEGLRPVSVEGLDDASWVLLDYGEFVVHVFLTETRAYYDLDRLWSDAPEIDWASTAAAAGERRQR